MIIRKRASRTKTPSTLELAVQNRACPVAGLRTGTIVRRNQKIRRLEFERAKREAHPQGRTLEARAKTKPALAVSSFAPACRMQSAPPENVNTVN